MAGSGSIGPGDEPVAGRRTFLVDVWGWVVAGAGGVAAALALLALKGRPSQGRQVRLSAALTDRADRDGGLAFEGVFILPRPPGAATDAAPEILDLRCAHLGCTVAREPSGGFRCPCHGSRYDAAGLAVSGPARGGALARPAVVPVPGGWTAALGECGGGSRKRGGHG